MQKVSRKESPVSTLFNYEINNDELQIGLDGSEQEEYYLDIAKNTIVAAIMLFYMNDGGKRLKRIKIRVDKSKYKNIIRFLQNQRILFDLDIELPEVDINTKYEFKDEWLSGIIRAQKVSEVDIENIRGKLLKKGIQQKHIDKLQYYESISSPIQISYKGYRVAEIDSLGNIEAVNNKGMELSKWVEYLIVSRSDPNDEHYYHVKEEHYLESVILEKIYSRTGWQTGGIAIKSLFDKQSVAFQFPVLLYSGKSSSKANHPKYIDVIAKSDGRPVIMELKVWGKTKSRGKYLFDAFGQIFNYYCYIYRLHKQEDRKFNDIKSLSGIYDWTKPILYVVTNDIREDETAFKFRTLIEKILGHLKNNIIMHFVEIDNSLWGQKREISIYRDICN
ncbi:MAG: hypothetical protein WC527_08395 [Candidatus Margulisiibacteriota bacterium]